MKKKSDKSIYKTISYSKEYEKIMNEASSKELLEAYIFIKNLQNAEIFNKVYSVFLYENIEVFKLLKETDLIKFKKIFEEFISFYYFYIKKEETNSLLSLNQSKEKFLKKDTINIQEKINKDIDIDIEKINSSKNKDEIKEPTENNENNTRYSSKMKNILDILDKA